VNLKAEYMILEKLLKTMDLPFNRKKDLNPAKIKWLSKRMGVKNSDHPNYKEAMEIIEELV
jgi:hypothetical protein